MKPKMMTSPKAWIDHFPAHLRRATRPECPFPTEPFSPPGWFAVGTVPACRCGRGCRKAFGSAGLGSNKWHGGISQAVDLRATKHTSRMPFPYRALQPSALVRDRNGSPLVVASAGVGRPLGLPGSVEISGTEVFRRP